MKQPHLLLRTRLMTFLGLVWLLSSCAPVTAVAPSGALKEQLNEIKQQQQDQAALVQQLQQQLVRLQQQLAGEETISAQIQGTLAAPLQSAVPDGRNTLTEVPANQFTASQEASNLAASASSYLTAFSNLAAGRPASAEAGFQDFLNNFPEHTYAPNARYWMAGAQLSQGKTEQAIANLQQIVVDPKAHSKAPAALMQLAQLYRQQGLSIQADNVLEQLRTRYPESPEAQHIYRGGEPAN